jgi:hypothetical protein
MVEEPAADEAWERGFRDWIRSNETYLDDRIVDAAPGDRALGWYRAVYSQNGAMPGSSLAELALEAGRGVLPRALEIVKSDIRSVPSQGLHLALEEGPVDHLRSANGIFLLGNRLISTATADAVIEIAEIVQEEVMGVLMQFWPSCPEHNAATYAALVEETAVWWCRTGDHALREIGEGCSS